MTNEAPKTSRGYRPTQAFISSGRSNTWRFDDFPPETTIEHLLNPETWSHCSARYFKAGDEVIVVPQSMPFRAHLFIMESGKTFAKMRLLDVTLLNATTVSALPIRQDADVASLATLPDDAPLSVEWKGPKRKFAIIRKSDGEIIRDGFAVKAEAEREAAKHIHAMA